ncbi:NaeI family type II restriction endonuclease [Microtetraspora malaysiensis]|uniref:NaeI family type II restriction endonuclease n=1 Tax=Microtetraspora malaysiensis TaxID=161358 RepID=UPI003D8FEFDA
MREGRLPENQLLSMPESVLELIFNRKLSKQERVTTLFRQVQGRIIHRRTLVTVAQQHDGPKRARDARLTVCADGILILGYRDGHPEIARDLGLTVPRQSEWISARVVPRPPGDERPTALIHGVQYVVARPVEDCHAIAPRYGTGE